MSMDEKMQAEQVQDALARLFAGREPREGWLARCPRLKAWHLRVQHAGSGREIVIHGILVSERFTVKNQPRMPVRVLWMDRKTRFVLTTTGMWNLGEQERGVDMNLTVPVEGE
jgi:hypothetical protein